MIATTTVSLYRGTIKDAYQDTVDDNDIPKWSNVPASIIERSRKVFVPAENRIQTVRYLTVRVRANTDVVAGDRMKDEQTEEFYSVDAVHQVQSVGYTADIVLDCRKV